MHLATLQIISPKGLVFFSSEQIPCQVIMQYFNFFQLNIEELLLN